jgi:hypothetical protein
MAKQSGEGDKVTDHENYASEFITTPFEKFAKLVDERQKEVKLATAGLALLGVAIIGRSIRIFTTFRYVDEIPTRFIKHHFKLRGCVKRVDDNGVLQIQHIPIVELWEKSNVRLLPITLAGGLSIPDPGRVWLRDNVVDHHVWFQPLSITHDDVLYCAVTTRLNWWRSTDLSEALVSRGLAMIQIDPLLRNIRSEDAVLARFETALMGIEARAQHRGRGVWARPSLVERLSRIPAAIADDVTGRITSTTRRVTELVDRIRNFRPWRRR